MSLLDLYYEDFVIMTRTIADDGYGGYTSTYIEGVTIKAALREDQSLQARVAEKQGVTSLCTIITSKSLNLQFYDVIKRVKNGQTYRITSNGDDNATPEVAAFDARVVTAEKWNIPSN